jgi:hypothetical protein
LSIKLKEVLQKKAAEFYGAIVKENLDSMEDGLQDVPKYQWKWAVNTVNLRCKQVPFMGTCI